MPIALALVIRKIIALFVTLAIYKTAEAFINAALAALPPILEKAFGISEEESKDFIHDFMIDQALAFGLTLFAFQKNMPIKVAEKLGFTTKGWSKVGFSKTMTTKIEGKIAGKIPVDLSKGEGYWKIMGKFMGLITAVFMATQSIEVFAYRPQFFTNILSFFGLGSISKKILQPPRKPLFSEEEVRQYAIGLNISEDVMKGYLEAAEDVVITQVKVPTQASVLAVVRNDLLEGKTGTDIGVAGSLKTPIMPVKVFTGIVSQGTLGEGLTFTPRQDDIIESIDELQSAAQNNLAPFLAALPSKVVYEVKIVSSITTKDGFRQTGQAQKVLSNYATDGTPRYKTVINKFATLTMYLLTEKGQRTKISTIILGPTDAVKFQPTQNHLAMLEKNIQASVVTSNVSEIKTIQTTMPITVQAPVAPPPAIPLPPPPPPVVSVAPSPISAPAVSSPAPSSVPTTDLTTLKAKLDQATNYYRTGMNPLPGTIGQGYVEMVAAQKAYDEALAKAPKPAVATTSSQDVAKQKATTLSEFYFAINQALPSMQDRAAYYEFLGLGKAAYYTGTAEQNTKLLYKLQGK